MKFDENLAALHGYLCGDGYVCTNLPHQKHKYYSIGLRNTNLTLLRDFQTKYHSVFSVKPKLIPKERCRIYSKEQYYQLMEFGPYRSRNWAYPKLAKYLLKYWLRAFFDCESWVAVRKGQDRRIALETVRRDNLPLIQSDLKKKFNISSVLHPRKNRPTSSIHLYGRENLLKFQKEIGFLHPDKKKKLQSAIDSYVEYDWKILMGTARSNDFFKNILKTRVRFKKPKYFRATSVRQENLMWLSRQLQKRNINSRISKLHNGQGNRYFELNINKKDSVRELLRQNLLNKEEVLKFQKTQGI